MRRLLLLLALGLPALIGSLSASAPVAQAAGTQLQIAVRHVHGRPPLAFVGERVSVHGTALPFVAGQRAVVRFYRHGHVVGSRNVAVQDSGGGVGRFRVGYTSPRTGTTAVRAELLATATTEAAGSRTQSVRFVAPHLSAGARGEAVRVLQTLLSRLHYAVPTSGYFDDATGRAVIAFRKMVGSARVPLTDPAMFAALARGRGAFHVRYARDGKHVEADLTRQVLAEIDPGGHVHRIYTMSSGKPSTPTVIGHFHVYTKDFGVNSEGMVDSNYFIRGYAIHGYPDVPTYAASHGCLRIPIPDAPAVYDWLSLGDTVDVYNEGGGGSHRVRGNAGP